MTDYSIVFVIGMACGGICMAIILWTYNKMN